MLTKPFFLHLCLIAVAMGQYSFELENGFYNNDGADTNQDCQVTCHEGYYPIYKEYNLTSDLAPPETLKNVSAYDYGLAQQMQVMQWQGYECQYCGEVQNIHGHPLPRPAFSMLANCTPLCIEPYYHRQQHNHTCVLCNQTCADGQYLTGPNCTECKSCMSAHRDNHTWQFISPGTLDDPASCREICRNGTYADVQIDADSNEVINVCKEFTNAFCSDTQFLVPGTHLHDNYCMDCEFECEGMHLIQPCVPGTGPQMKCQSCEIEHPSLQTGEMWVGSNCTTACIEPRVRNQDTQACEMCDYVCPPGQHFTENRRDCFDCAPCSANIPEHADYVTGCEWMCDDYYEFNSTNNKCEKFEEAVPAAPAMERLFNFKISCDKGEHLTITGCKACDRTHLPSQELEGKTWDWLPSKTSCSWECLPGYYAFSVGQTWLCRTWEEYLTAIQGGIAVNSTLSDAKFKNRRKQHTIPMLAEWQLVTISVLVVFTAIYAFS